MFLLRYTALSALVLALLCPGLPAQRPAKPAAAVKPAGMTNDDVIAIVGAGLNDQVVIAKIKAASSTAFDTSVAGLQSLKAANVSANVIAFMIDPTAAPAAVPAPAVAAAPVQPSNPDDPMSAHSPGIYILAKGTDGQAHLTMLQRAPVKDRKSGGFLASSHTLGIVKEHRTDVFDGAHAGFETPETTPTFFVYTLMSRSSFGGARTDAKELIVAKLDVKGDTRTLNVSSASMWGSHTGVDDKHREGFTTSDVKPGVQKITFTTPLPAGEYAFQAGQQFFEFGIAGSN